MWQWFKRALGRDPKHKVMQDAIDNLEQLRMQYRAWDDDKITTSIVKGVEKSMHEQLQSKHQPFNFMVFMREETDTHFQREFMAVLKQLALDLTPSKPEVQVHYSNREIANYRVLKLYPPGQVVISAKFIRTKPKKPIWATVAEQE